LSSDLKDVMRIDLMSILLIISAFCFTSLNAQTEAGKDTLQSKPALQGAISMDPLDLEIGEMIFDETITKVGRDFYELFFNSWNNPTQIKDFSITIKERPLPGMGTQIRVFMDEHEILSQFIQPNVEQIEMLAEYTVALASSYLLNYQDIQSQLQNEDQAGTGIF